MKKLLLITIILVSTSQFLQAQTEFGGSLSINQTRAFEEVTRGGDTDFGIGISLGLFAEIRLSDKFTFMPELKYNWYNSQSDQIMIPVLFKYKLSKKFNVFTGPNMRLHLSDITTDNKIEFGLTLGTEYELNDRFSIDFRYNHGMSKTEQKLHPENPYRMNSLEIGLKYRF